MNNISWTRASNRVKWVLPNLLSRCFFVNLEQSNQWAEQIVFLWCFAVINLNGILPSLQINNWCLIEIVTKMVHIHCSWHDNNLQYRKKKKEFQKMLSKNTKINSNLSIREKSVWIMNDSKSICLPWGSLKPAQLFAFGLILQHWTEHLCVWCVHGLHQEWWHCIFSIVGLALPLLVAFHQSGT